MRQIRALPGARRPAPSVASAASAAGSGLRMKDRPPGMDDATDRENRPEAGTRLGRLRYQVGREAAIGFTKGL